MNALNNGAFNAGSKATYQPLTPEVRPIQPLRDLDVGHSLIDRPALTANNARITVR